MQSSFRGWFVLLVLITWLISGCSPTGGMIDLEDTTPEEPIEKLPQLEMKEFILGVGDTINIAVYRQKTSEYTMEEGDSLEISVYRNKSSEYQIGLGDQVEVKVFGEEDLNRTINLSANGNIQFPLIGDIQAAGQTPAQLREKVTHELKKFLVKPQVTVDVERKSVKVDDLTVTAKIDSRKEGFITFPLIGEVKASGKTVTQLRTELQERLGAYLYDPQVTIDVTPNQTLQIADLSQTLKVDATGKVMMPVLGEITVAGKGIWQLRDEIQAELTKKFVGPQVVISLGDVASSKYMVLGEVQNPGAFVLSSRVTLIEAIMTAGGPSSDADQSSVALVRKEGNASKIYLADVSQLYKDGKLSQNTVLASDDIIYVPPKWLATTSRFFSYISSILGPVVNLESGIVLWPDVDAVLKGEGQSKGLSLTP